MFTPVTPSMSAQPQEPPPTKQLMTCCRSRPSFAPSPFMSPGQVQAVGTAQKPPLSSKEPPLVPAEPGPSVGLADGADEFEV